MRILAIDPGTEQSGFVLYEDGRVLESGVRLNGALAASLSTAGRGHTDEDGCCWPPQVDRLVIEMVASYGMPVGKEVFETCVWIGRFMQAWNGKEPAHRLYRREVKLHLCDSMKAKDANIRQALIDRFGPVGTKNAPGKLYGVKSHAWAALALAVTAADLPNVTW